MIGFTELDLLVRGGSLALLALWSWLLWRDHRAELSARVAIAMNVTIAAHIIATLPGPMQTGSVIDYLVEMASVSVPALFWLFARTWFNDERQIGWKGWAAITVSCLMVAVQIRIYAQTGAPSLPLAVVLRSAMFGFAAAGLWIAWKGREDDLVEGRRRIRLMLVGTVGMLVIITNAVEVLVWLGRLPEVSRNLIEFGILAFAFILIATMAGFRDSDLFRTPAPRDTASTPPTTADPLAARLESWMASERPYRDETLTIAALAAQLGEQEYRLRRVINGALGHRNFAAFLNGYRLAEVKAALADPEQKEVPILTIALDAGFGSLGPFNRAFREAEGMTPSEYRRAGLIDSGIG
jgi:AraC-like DNA-binding protein